MGDLLLPSLAHLQSLQNRILERIQVLEESFPNLPPSNATPVPPSHLANGSALEQLESEQHAMASASQNITMEEKLGRILLESGVTSFQFRRVPHDYYARTFEQRRDLLGAASVDHLCKSIVMVNTQAHESVNDCSDFNNSKFYLVIVQYTARLNAEKVRQFVYSLNNGKIPKKRFNMRLAPEDEAYRLTGFSHNAVTPIGMRSEVPVILSDAITKLRPNFFWLGGGEVDLKLGINTQEFIKIVNPFIADCS